MSPQSLKLWISIVLVFISRTVDCYLLDCTEDYSPCSCTVLDYPETQLMVSTVNCTDIYTQDIQLVFSRTTTQVVDRLYLTLPSDIGELPINLLSGKAAKKIVIGGSEGRNGCQLPIHPDAFDSSAPYVERLQIWGCDLATLNFEFIRKFSNLNELFISGVSSIKAIQYLPSHTETVIDFTRYVRRNQRDFVVKLSCS